MENEVMFIKLDDIIPNRFQPREVFEEESLNKLADSIRRHGVIEPILVRPVSNKFEIIAGERRYKASVLAGLTKIPAIVKQMDDKESSIVAYIENEHRSGVSAIEEARTIDRILKSNDMTQEELAKELGINQSTLANKLRLLSLPMKIQESLMNNEISERHARSLLSVKDEAKQIELLDKIKTNKMTVRELDSEIKNMNNDDNTNNNELNEYMTNNPFNESMPNFINQSSDNTISQNNIYNGIIDNNTDFTDYLNNDVNNNQKDSYIQNEKNIHDPYLGLDDRQNNSELPNYLNDFDSQSTENYNDNILDENTSSQETGEDPSFMSFLNNYDNNNPLPEETKITDDKLSSDLDNYNETTINNQNIGSFHQPFYDNIYSTNNYEEPKESNVIINDVNPPITSGFSNDSYIENNPNFVDVSQNNVIDSVDTVINKLKVVVDDIKENSKFKIDTDEINYDDMYQITIKIDKRDF